MKQEKRDDINDRYYGVLAERSLYPDHNSYQYKELTQIAQLILDEFKVGLGKHPRHIMFMRGTHYDFRCE